MKPQWFKSVLRLVGALVGSYVLVIVSSLLGHYIVIYVLRSL